MNKLEGKLVRSIFKPMQSALNQNLWNNAYKLCNNQLGHIGKRTDTNILAHLLSERKIDINDINRLGREIWSPDRIAVIQALSVVMLGACGYGPRHDADVLPIIHKHVSDEAGTKKALNLKGWVTGTEIFPKHRMFIAISTGGDGFIFDGDGKTRYFIWNFDTNNYKFQQNRPLI
jgi:hypothetical protein